MNDPRAQELDARVRALTETYNGPRHDLDPERRDELWARIQSARTSSTRPTAPRMAPRRRNALQTFAAVAAVLLIGIAIGRWTIQTRDPTPIVAETPSRTITDEALRYAARDYLLRTETLLTEFRLAAAAPLPEAPGPGSGSWASGLLLETRLLMDSPVAESPEFTRLLRDLELILAEIVQLSGESSAREREEIESSLEERGVLLRLRRAVPAKTGTRGA